MQNQTEAHIKVEKKEMCSQHCEVKETCPVNEKPGMDIAQKLSMWKLKEGIEQNY